MKRRVLKLNLRRLWLSEARRIKADVTFTSQLLVKVLGGELKPDRVEISDLRYFTLNEMESRSDVPKLNTWIAKRTFEKTALRFSLSEYKPDPRQLYELWF